MLSSEGRIQFHAWSSTVQEPGELSSRTPIEHLPPKLLLPSENSKEGLSLPGLCPDTEALGQNQPPSHRASGELRPAWEQNQPAGHGWQSFADVAPGVVRRKPAGAHTELGQGVPQTETHGGLSHDGHVLLHSLSLTQRGLVNLGTRARAQMIPSLILCSVSVSQPSLPPPFRCSAMLWITGGDSPTSHTYHTTPVLTSSCFLKNFFNVLSPETSKAGPQLLLSLRA